jgi:putative SOS response-associated peptidase YedK
LSERLRDLPVLAMRGNGDGDPRVISFSIVTYEPAPSSKHIRDRMPVILNETQWQT